MSADGRSASTISLSHTIQVAVPQPCAASSRVTWLAKEESLAATEAFPTQQIDIRITYGYYSCVYREIFVCVLSGSHGGAVKYRCTLPDISFLTYLITRLFFSTPFSSPGFIRQEPKYLWEEPKHLFCLKARSPHSYAFVK